jgi:hypothetical protein
MIHKHAAASAPAVAVRRSARVTREGRGGAAGTEIAGVGGARRRRRTTDTSPSAAAAERAALGTGQSSPDTWDVAGGQSESPGGHGRPAAATGSRLRAHYWR